MNNGIILSRKEQARRRFGGALARFLLLAVTAVAAVALLAIIGFIGYNAIPFFTSGHAREFFTGRHWYPSDHPPQFGAVPLFVGSGLVTAASLVLAVPVGLTAAICLSDILPFRWSEALKPAVEMLAAIPSVAYGFFALVILAPLLQNHGPTVLRLLWWSFGAPGLLIIALVLGETATALTNRASSKPTVRVVAILLLLVPMFLLLRTVDQALAKVVISSGTNALNASLILALMMLPTIVSVSQDALQAVGSDLRAGSYALGATRAETLVKIVIPAAGSGILSAIILGCMRAIGETMVVWMASGNAAQIPEPWYNLLQPVRTITATIAGDMGEADQMTGSARYHVLFALGLCLLLFSLVSSGLAERAVARQRRRLRGE
jgi:phosphate transport system permease protein